MLTLALGKFIWISIKFMHMDVRQFDKESHKADIVDGEMLVSALTFHSQALQRS